MKTKIIKNITYWSGVVILGLVVGISIQFVAAWTEPTQAPPGGNVGAPLNTGNLGQIKNGNLILNALGNYLTGLLVNGNLQIANGKGYSPSTTEADPGNTLVTKDYVDAQSGGGGCQWFDSVNDGLKVCGPTGNKYCGISSGQLTYKVRATANKLCQLKKANSWAADYYYMGGPVPSDNPLAWGFTNGAWAWQDNGGPCASFGGVYCCN